MERGGADPIGKEPLLYPRGNVEELKKLRDLVTALGIDALIVRMDRDLDTTSRTGPLVVPTNRNAAAVRPIFCTLCRTHG